MKKWLVTIAALWLAGCSSGEINKNYYQLPVVQSGTQSTASQGNRLLWVEQVAVPDYLAGNGVVYQTSDVKYVIANNNLWASPLDQQLRNTPLSPHDSQIIMDHLNHFWEINELLLFRKGVIEPNTVSVENIEHPNVMKSIRTLRL